MGSPIELLRWDSRFFGRRIARLNGSGLTPARMLSATKTCLRQRVDCLYFLASADDSLSISSAEAHGFQMVDIRVTLTKDLMRSFPLSFASHAVAFRPARSGDIGRLKTLAKTLFPSSRFAVDPHFPPEASPKLFASWIAKSVRGRFDHWVGVAVSRGRLAGFVSCRRTGRASGLIGLIGVASPFRRRGIGRNLLNQGFEWFRRQGISQISVVTQGRAVGAQRLYQDCGFRTSHVDLWYHQWF
jgi:dTDP-4-amino-4,6-dideoxy-D-galactose acyltransferase